MKYIEEYLVDVLHIRPLGEVTSVEDNEFIRVLVDKNEVGIMISFKEYASWVDSKLEDLETKSKKDYVRLEDNSITAVCRIYNEVLAKNPERAILTSAPWADFVREVKEKFKDEVEYKWLL